MYMLTGLVWTFAMAGLCKRTGSLPGTVRVCKFARNIYPHIPIKLADRGLDVTAHLIHPLDTHYSAFTLLFTPLTSGGSTW